MANFISTPTRGRNTDKPALQRRPPQPDVKPSFCPICQRTFQKSGALTHHLWQKHRAKMILLRPSGAWPSTEEANEQALEMLKAKQVGLIQAAIRQVLKGLAIKADIFTLCVFGDALPIVVTNKGCCDRVPVELMSIPTFRGRHQFAVDLADELTENS